LEIVVRPVEEAVGVAHEDVAAVERQGVLAGVLDPDGDEDVPLPLFCPTGTVVDRIDDLEHGQARQLLAVLVDVGNDLCLVVGAWGGVLGSGEQARPQREGATDEHDGERKRARQPEHSSLPSSVAAGTVQSLAGRMRPTPLHSMPRGALVNRRLGNRMPDG